MIRPFIVPSATTTFCWQQSRALQTRQVEHSPVTGQIKDLDRGKSVHGVGAAAEELAMVLLCAQGAQHSLAGSSAALTSFSSIAYGLLVDNRSLGYSMKARLVTKLLCRASRPKARWAIKTDFIADVVAAHTFQIYGKPPRRLVANRVFNRKTAI
jgi:hypothetical protein